MANRSPGDTPHAEGSGGLILGIIAVVIVLAMIGQCSSDDSELPAPEQMMDANMGAAIAQQAPASPEPLSAGSVQRGTRDLSSVLEAASYSGAMIYSQNCYDALGRDFSWSRLDVCGAFDALTSRALLSDETPIGNSEEGYFQSEASAGRYLAAATSAGETPEDADARLANLQSRIALTPLPVAQPSTEADPVVNDADRTGTGETTDGDHASHGIGVTQASITDPQDETS